MNMGMAMGNGMGANGMGSAGTLTPQGMQPGRPHAQHVQQASQTPTSGTASTNQTQGKDPFADLVGLF